jgi:hypothetical protein
MPSAWFIVKPDRQLGPYTSAQIKQLAASGQLKTADLLRKADQTTTVAAGKIRGLFPENEAVSTPATLETATRQEGGFLRYLADYYAATHGLGDRLLAFVLGLIAMAVLSLLKPTLGYRGIVLIVAGVAGLTVVAAFWFLLRRISGYFLGHERYVPDDALSWSSVIAYGGMTALLPLCLLVAVEYSNPQQGVLATLIPRLKEEQRRWLVLVEDKSKPGGIETGVAKVGAVGERGVAEGASSRSDPALSQLTPQQEPRVPDKAAQKSSGESALATTENLTPEQEENRPASTLPKDRSKAANRPPASADSASTDRPSSTKAADSASPSEAIVAEGVGTTPDEALKDAFRNAVRQVVGAVVDAETLIKDDQVIDDKVLTYSDGFIKTFEEVPGFKKSQGGLHRLKIKAAVERRSVVAKLKAAKVTVKEVDGKGMFAEVVTKLEGEADAKALIAKAFADYPESVVQAVVKGKPSVETKNGKTNLVYELELSVDLARYETFQKKIVELLRKVAQSKGECFVIADEPSSLGHRWRIPPWNDEKAGGFGKVWNTSNLNITDDIVIAINTKRNGLHDRTTWEWFTVPRPGVTGQGTDHGYLVMGATFQKVNRVDVLFVDSNQEEVLRDSLVTKTHEAGDPYHVNDTKPKLPGLFVWFQHLSHGRGPATAVVSPYICIPESVVAYGNYGYDIATVLRRDIAVTPEELSRIAAIKTVVK